MACVNVDGEITQSARQILEAMLQPASLPQIAERTGLPLYRIRSASRELSEAGLAVEVENGWITTDVGRSAIERVSAAA